MAISPQQPEYSRKVRGMQKLTFDLLWDKQNLLAEQMGLKYAMPSSLRELYRDAFSTNLKLYHGDDEWSLPIPARFLIDTQGAIQYAEASADHTSRPDPDDLMAALKALPE